MKPSPAENLARLLEGKSGYWIPFSLDVGPIYGLTDPAHRIFQEQTGAADATVYFDADWRLFSLQARFGGDEASRWHSETPASTTFDEWGIGHQAAGSEATVERTLAPLARAESIADVEALPVPIIDTSADGSSVQAHHRAGYLVFGYAGSVYEWSWWLRGMENFLVDLLERPALAEAVIDKVAGHTMQLALATARAGVDVLCFFDDAGMQRGMQIAPALWRRYIKPAWSRVLGAVRSEFPAAKFFLHSCGKIEAIVPDVIELGFDILHPIQPECMDFGAVHRHFGRDILLAATISAQRIFPFGTPDEVGTEVRRLAELVGSDRRCLLMPSNRIQPETPWENVVAFAEACRGLRGW